MALDVMTESTRSSHKASKKSSKSISKSVDENSTRSETDHEIEDLPLEVKEITQLLPNTTIVTHCILKNDPARFIRCFDDHDDPYRDDIFELINKRDNCGKSPLDVAAKLGRVALTRELITRGAEVNDCSAVGYSCLHYAAAWGRINVLRIQVENGGSVQHRNNHGETPRDTALRYTQMECVNYLDWVEARTTLHEAIRQTHETILDIDRSIPGKIPKDEKTQALNAVKTAQDWFNMTLDAKTEDYISRRLALFETCTPLLSKLSENLLPGASPRKSIADLHFNRKKASPRKSVADLLAVSKRTAANNGSRLHQNLTSTMTLKTTKGSTSDTPSNSGEKHISQVHSKLSQKQDKKAK